MKLSPAQTRTLKAIARLTQKRGISPTIRELAKELRYASANAVTGILQRLVAHGAVKKDPKSPRSLRITAKGSKALGV